MELNRKRAKVTILPTKDITSIFKDIAGDLFYKPRYDRDGQYQHLYFITDDEIKEGDWFIFGNTFQKANSSAKGKELGIINWKEIIKEYNCKKIVATTDKLLGLPQPSEAFVQKYCEVGGIDEVDIEYEFEYFKGDIGLDFKPIIKVDSHNTITIHPIKNSWNRDEVESLIFNFMKFFANKHKIRFDDGIKVSQWIKENLK